MQGFQIDPWRRRFGTSLGPEYPGCSFEQLSLPLGDLVRRRLLKVPPSEARWNSCRRLDIEVLCQFGQRLFALHGGQSHLRLEGRCVVPAEPVEALVLDALRKGDEAISSSMQTSVLLSDREIVARELDRITVHPERIDIRLACDCTENPDAEPRLVSVPWIKPSPARKREILLPEVTAPSDHPVRPMRVEEQTRLLDAIAKARSWLDELIAGTVSDIAMLAERERKTARSVRMILSVAFLDPAIVTAAVRGNLPRGYGVSRLVDLPPAFADQWAALGLTRPTA